MNTNVMNKNMEKLLHHAIDTYETCALHEEWDLSKVSILQKLLHERKLRKLLEKALQDIPNLEESSLRHMSQSEKDRLKTKFIDTAQTLDQEKLLYTTPFLMNFMHIGFLETTEEFFAKSQEFEPGFKGADLFQAVRNVWIMNCLQLLFHQKVQLTSSIFSYSLLYPYTDNFLDDPAITGKEKASFNHMVYQKILGNSVPTLTPYETKVFSLLEKIEKEFPREEFPMVYESLWYIQDAQVKSMLQGTNEVTSQEILKLSFYKGGASVLADACLVKGVLSDNERIFAFGYGTFLQLLDDLQDRIEDAALKHRTLYSNIPLDVYLDEYVERLLRYIDAVLASFDKEDGDSTPMKEIIRSCMRMMVESVIGKNPTYVTRSYYRTLESYASVRLSFYPAMERLLNVTLRKKDSLITSS